MQVSPLTLNNNGQAAQPCLGGSEDNPAAPHSVTPDSPNTRMLAEPGSQQPPQEAHLSDLTRDLEMGLPQRRPAPPSEGDSSQDLPEERQMDSLTQVTLSMPRGFKLGFCFAAALAFSLSWKILVLPCPICAGWQGA